jgi:hypothetical protein
VPADPTTWATVSALSTTCPVAITIDSSHFGSRGMTANGSDPTFVDTDAGATNYFWAEPQFNGTPLANQNQVMARMHLSDWGSQVGTSTIGGPEGATWTQITAVTNPSTLVTPTDFVPNGVGTGSSGAVATDTVEFACPTNTPTMTCNFATSRFQPADTNGHQCIQVELAPVPGSGVTISTPNAYRNMRFDSLSTKSWPATISIAGLQAITGLAAPRWVYVMVYTHNMPAIGDLPVLLDTIDMAIAQLSATTQVSILDFFFGSSMTSEQKLKSVWPTYDVHVFYDTGGTLKMRDGTILPWLAPKMVGYKYFLNHSGALFGFANAIHSMPGSPALTQIATDGYKVLIPNEGSIQIQNGVTASEQPASSLAADFFCALFPWAC